MSEEATISAADNWFIGEDKTLRFTVLDSTGTAAQNITGWALEWILRTRPDAEGTAIYKAGTAAITITDGSAGICDVAIADTDTGTLSPGEYYHTLRRTDEGSETVLSFGKVSLRQAASR